MIKRANVMLTRRCNMACPGCRVVESGRMELSTEGWITAFDILKREGVKFVQLYGGEPTLRTDLPALVKHCNSIDLPYTIVTNSVMLLRDSKYYDQLMEAEPRAITCSLGMQKFGEELISLLLNDHYPGEITTNILVTKETLTKIPALVTRLSMENIGSILFFLHLGDKTWNYRGTVEDENRFRLHQLEVDSLARWILNHYDGLCLRNSKRYFEAWYRYGIWKDWKCNGLTSLQVDANGRVSVCQDKKSLNYSVHELTAHRDEIVSACNAQALTCTGCFYDCYFEHDNTDRLEVKSR